MIKTEHIEPKKVILFQKDKESKEIQQKTSPCRSCISNPTSRTHTRARKAPPKNAHLDRGVRVFNHPEKA